MVVDVIACQHGETLMKILDTSASDEQVWKHRSYMSCIVRKPAFCICENKDADQLRGNRKADQRLCFRYIGSIIPLVPKNEISSLAILCGCTAWFVSDLV